MRAILDVNILLVLSDPEHEHYVRTQTWYSQNAISGWASCPLTQNGFLRIRSQSRYVRPRPLAACFSRLSEWVSQSDHEFWPDDLSLLDSVHIDHSRILSQRHLTDIYLLALAVKHGGRLATLDRGVPLAAVRSAGAERLVVV